MRKGFSLLLIFIVLSSIMMFSLVSASYWTARLNTNITAYYPMSNYKNTISTRFYLEPYGASNFGNVTGIIGTALNSTGVSGSYVNVTNSTYIRAYSPNGFTYNLWTNTSQESPAGSYKAIFAFGNPTNSMRLISYDNKPYVGTGGCVGTADINCGASCTEINKTGWNMITVTLNATHIAIYQNGLNKASQPLTCDINGSNYHYLGAETPTTRNYAIRIDEMGIWNRTLNDTEINILYNSGNGITQSYETVTLINPADGISTAQSWINFSASEITTSTLRNATLYIWNSSGIFNTSLVNITNSINQSNFTNAFSSSDVGPYTWNVLSCTSDSIIGCYFAPLNYSFNYGVQFNSINYSQSIFESSPDTYALNISVPVGASIVSSNLYYNGTQYGTNINIGSGSSLITRTLTTPTITTTTNYQFYFEVVISDGTNNNYFNSSTYTQTVSNILIDDCSTYTVRILNLTIFDEDSQVRLSTTAGSADNGTIETEVQFRSSNGSVYANYSTNKTNVNPVGICVSTDFFNNTEFKMYLQNRYYSTTRVYEYFYVQNQSVTNNTRPIIINLYDLLNTNSQEFLITVRDKNLVPISDAIVLVNRQYLPLGVFKSVEAPKTDQDGKTIAHLVLADNLYNIYVYKEGRLISSHLNIRPYCTNLASGDCKLILDEGTGNVKIEDVLNKDSWSSYFTLDKNTRILTYTFASIIGATRSVNLTVLKYDISTNTTICSNTVSASSGYLTCTIPAQYENNTILAQVILDGVLYSQSFFNMQGSLKNTLDDSRYIFAFLLIITLPLLAFSSPAFMIVFFIIGLVLASAFFLVDDGIFSMSSAFMWIILASVIILVKMSRRNNN
jgi:hypothetical protein